ncbi:hypothetical protein TSACC_2870 [Terrimicrobium sacchariphilum]|uniref:Uncharacterized protein n=1 Tax=Terrimicrobium sacchariphilum TaxID=690879 RepID=A0A146G4D7_TERSA|nr:hypothetical protein [Terrimicrobium sacchariphilum]GAT32471.1 hypothetical protein TSACC_2870 [Terrimicrobium sacchariphilum]
MISLGRLVSGRALCLAGVMALAMGASQAAEPVMKERTNLRNQRYGEILVVKGGPWSYTATVYNTVGLNDCPEAAWKKLDAKALKKELGARTVILNGPRHFMMDSNALKNPGGVSTFDGLEARRLATVDITLPDILRGRSKPYTGNTVNRTTRYVYKAGLPVYELVSPKGDVYVMQSYSLQVDPTLTAADLPNLGKKLKLPKGWQYRVVTPKEDLVLTTSGTATVLQDELLNSYQKR